MASAAGVNVSLVPPLSPTPSHSSITPERPCQREANTWLIRYNARRCNHGDYMAGRTPKHILDNRNKTRAS